MCSLLSHAQTSSPTTVSPRLRWLFDGTSQRRASASAYSTWMASTEPSIQTSGSSPRMAMRMGHQLPTTRPPLLPSLLPSYASPMLLFPPTCTPIVMVFPEGHCRGTSSSSSTAPPSNTHLLPNSLEGNSFEAIAGAPWMSLTLRIATSCRSDLRYFITWILSRNTRGNTFSRSSKRNMLPTTLPLLVTPFHRSLTLWVPSPLVRDLY